MGRSRIRPRASSPRSQRPRSADPICALGGTGLSEMRDAFATFTTIWGCARLRTIRVTWILPYQCAQIGLRGVRAKWVTGEVAMLVALRSRRLPRWPPGLSVSIRRGPGSTPVTTCPEARLAVRPLARCERHGRRNPPRVPGAGCRRSHGGRYGENPERKPARAGRQGRLYDAGRRRSPDPLPVAPGLPTSAGSAAFRPDPAAFQSEPAAFPVGTSRPSEVENSAVRPSGQNLRPSGRKLRGAGDTGRRPRRRSGPAARERWPRRG